MDQRKENGKMLRASVLMIQNHAHFSWNVLQVTYNTTSSNFHLQNVFIRIDVKMISLLLS